MHGHLHSVFKDLQNNTLMALYIASICPKVILHHVSGNRQLQGRLLQCDSSSYIDSDRIKS